MAGKAAFHTLGCKVNAYETEAMAEQLRRAGYTIVPFEPGADVYIVNTCTVTGIADRKSRQMLRRAREMNPDAVVVAAGCYAEAPEVLPADPVADILVGNHDKGRLAEVLAEYLSGRERACGGDSAGIAGVKLYDETPVSGAFGRTRAYIKIQDGCNQFCSYCVIPYVRGRVRSRRKEAVVAEAETLAEAGFREVVLTGIHISSYGLDFEYPGENRRTPEAREAVTNRRLLSLIREIAGVPGITRIRLGSLEPGIMTEEFIAGITDIPEVCRAFHLSLQSGCDETLRRMRRRYTVSDYRRICGLIRRYCPDAAITTDIIAGFPGETEEEFLRTKEFVREIRFSKTHVFQYSRRRGTAAAAMEDQVPDRVRKARSAELIAMDREARRAYAETFSGRDVEVLFEEPSGTEGFMRGHTREYLEAEARAGEETAGRILVCRVTSVGADGTLGVCPVQENIE